MEPVNMAMPDGSGYAVASSKSDIATLTAQGYVAQAEDPAVPMADPAESDQEGHTVESARAALDAAGIEYDNRWGVARLVALLPA